MRQAAAAALLRYAHDTNDTLRLAATVVAMVVTAAERAVGNVHSQALVLGKRPRCEDHAAKALAQGWRPFRFIHKALWWDCSHAPENEEAGDQPCSSDEPSEDGEPNRNDCIVAHSGHDKLLHACQSSVPNSFADGACPDE